MPQTPSRIEAPPALAAGRVHEVSGDGAWAFAAAQAGLRQPPAAPVIWILPPGPRGTLREERPDPYGLAIFFDPGNLILVDAVAEADVFWAMEEALRAGLAPVIVAETASRGPWAQADLTRSRRLQLAAENGGGVGVLITPEGGSGRSNAAETRWRAEAMAACDHAEDPFALCWRWTLLKNKHGPCGGWHVEWRTSGAARWRRRANGEGQTHARRTDPADSGQRAHSSEDRLFVVAAGGGGGRAAA